MKKCIYPGTFDPITIGHLDIIERAYEKCDEELILAVYNNKTKRCRFTLEEREEMVKLTVQDKFPNIKVIIFDTLLIDLAEQNGTGNIIRGIRNATDFEYEQNLFQINRKLYQDFETIFLIAKNDNKHISSSAVRELIALKGDFASFVPLAVAKYIKGKL